MDERILKKKRIGVLMGGTSSEREVSLRSGNAVFKTLKAGGYNVKAIDAAGDLCRILKKEKIQAAFLVLHGGSGENGGVQGLLEVMKIPYTGSGVLASALAMDKEASKKIFVYHRIPVPPFRIVERSALKMRSGAKKNKTKKSSECGPLNFGPERIFPLPWVVKPASEGSSVGVEIVKTREALLPALRQAFSYGEKAVIEKYTKGKEVQIGILNGRALGGVEVKPSLEFYNYEAKYTAGLTEYIFPPRLSKEAYEKAEIAALAAHNALGCSGATRVDLIIDRSGNPFVLEVNTIPGMTETSLLPKIALQAGLDFSALLAEILRGVFI